MQKKVLPTLLADLIYVFMFDLFRNFSSSFITKITFCLFSCLPSDQFQGPSITTLGANKVIPGLEKGLSGMCEGERREVVIPPHWAHGENGGQSSGWLRSSPHLPVFVFLPRVSSCLSTQCIWKPVTKACPVHSNSTFTFRPPFSWSGGTCWQT